LAQVETAYVERVYAKEMAEIAALEQFVRRLRRRGGGQE
jgi:hypothetical protein